MASQNDSLCIARPTDTNGTWISVPSTAMLVWLGFTGVLCFVGSTANLLVLIVLLKYRVLRQGAGLLICHLLVCGFALSSCYFPIYMSRVNAVMTGIVPCGICRRQHSAFNALRYRSLTNRE